MICLTGDIHHMTLGTQNQKHSDITEMDACSQFLHLLEDAGVKVTFFISGKCFTEEWDSLKCICESPLVQIGGHNYDCFENELWHRINKKLWGSYNGPRWYQKRDALKTIDIIKEKCDITINAWRNHMYMHGPHTENVLHECGIDVCADGVQKDANGMIPHPSGLLNFPLNVMPDHEHLYHAERTPEWVKNWQKRYNWSDDYGPHSYYIEQWTERVLDELQRHEENAIISHMIIHPITMYLCDNFTCFTRILEFLASHETVHVNDVLSHQLAHTAQEEHIE